jgi:cation:H+ antiporter
VAMLTLSAERALSQNGCADLVPRQDFWKAPAPMWFDLLLLAIGGPMLYFGAEWLVQGAAGMAVRLGVRPLLIGLTIVSYSTSSPELAVSISASLQNESAIVLGNVIGSNIANIAIILGLTAIIAPPRSDGSMAGKELVILLLATAAVPLFFYNGTMDRWEGVIFVLGSVLFTYLTIRWSKQRPADADEVPQVESRSKGALIGIGVLGLAVLIVGGEIFVRGGVGLAQKLGVDERVIGLTIVAVGTSVPELAASVVAALRGHSDIAIGNVIGSNIFNILLILGGSVVLSPLSVNLSDVSLDLGFAMGLAVVVAVMLWKPRRITRVEGGLLIASYLVFLGLLFRQM